MRNALSKLSAGRPRWRLLIAALLLLGGWLLFFDSHSVVKRYRWHQELEHLEQENADLRRQIEELDHTLKEGLSEEDIERIAREQYGMRRPGETVYRVKPRP